MKLIIQIPCFNEEKTLPKTIRDLPRKINKIETIEYLLINDGSTDNTVEVGKKLGVHHIVNFPENKGLSKAFMAGLDACLKLGADIIVNTDADNQYKGEDIERLIMPILEGRAEIVIGQRNIDAIKDFSRAKKILQKFGSWVVKIISGTKISDAPCGFRAFSREAALKVNVFSNYTYTLETIIQAGRKNIIIGYIPISTNIKTRESRLIKSTWKYIIVSLITIFRIFVVYKPLRFFMAIASILLAISLFFLARFAYFYLIGLGNIYIKSLIAGGTLITLSMILFMIGLIADIIATNRILIEDIQYRVRKIEYNLLAEKKGESIIGDKE